MIKDQFKKTGLCVGIAISAMAFAACGGGESGDSSEEVTCGENVCLENQECDEATKTCVEKGGTVVTHNCGNVDCDLTTQVCNENKQCVAKEDEDKCGAGQDKCGADGSCVDVTSNKEHCGKCGEKCGENQECQNSVCTEIQGGNEDECSADEDDQCDGNAVKSCENGSYVTTPCGSLEKCEKGACVDDPDKCNPDEFEAQCDSNSNSVVKCNGGVVERTPCNENACEISEEGPKCSESQAECKADDEKSCNEDGTIHECVNGQWTDSSCGDNFECGDGENGKECVEKEAVCNDDDPVTCEGVSLKSCENGQFKISSCENAGETCVDGECVKVEVKLCPDNPDDGKQLPGECGCAIPDTDLNNNGIIDCLEQRKNKDLDLCPDDPDKTLPGVCGCGVKDEPDGDSFKCLTSQADYCPNDPNKTLPGVCGCNHPDTFNNLTMMPWCNGYSSVDKHFFSCDEKTSNGKHLFGICGCSVKSSDEPVFDDNGKLVCPEEVSDKICPDDGDPSVDTDKDGVPDCLDKCPANEFKYFEDSCDCSKVRVNIDGKEYCATPIRTADDFNNLVKSKSGWSNSQYDVYALMNDIDLGEAIGHVASVDWTSSITFNGKLVSDGKKISYTNQGAASLLKCPSGSSCGLFNGLGGTARIHNIKLEFNIEGAMDQVGMLAGFANSGANISNIEAVGNVKGGSGSDARVGGVIGYGNAMTVSSVSHEGNVVSSSTGTHVGGVFGRLNGKNTVSSISNKGDVSGQGNGVGGLFGRIDSGSVASDLSYEGNVKTTGANYVGGIAGYSVAALSKVSVKGKVEGRRYVGGISGYHNNNITDAKNEAEINVKNDTGSQYAYVGGIIGQYPGGYTLENVHNVGNIKVNCEPRHYTNNNGNDATTKDTCAMVGGIVGHIANASVGSVLRNVSNTSDIQSETYYIGGIVGFAYSTQIEDAKNTGNISGSEQIAGIAGRLDQVGSAASKKVEWKMANCINEGSVIGTSAHHGGMVGYYLQRSANEVSTFSELYNKGAISGTSYQGGIIGLFRQNGTTNISNVYSSGDITGTSDNVGGLFASLHENNESSVQQGSAKRSLAVNIDRVWAKGNVTGKNNVGGLVGRAPTDMFNRKTPNNSYERKRCPDKTSVYRDEYDFTNFDVDYTLKVTNAYAEGKVKGNVRVGGLIGYVWGSSRTAYTYDTTIYSFGANCAVTETPKTTNAHVRNGKLILANAYASGQVESTSNDTTAGGLIGSMTYSTNQSGAAWNYLLNNVYATGIVQETAGSLLGAKPNTTNITFKNIYYWENANNQDGKFIGAGNVAIAAAVPFHYEDGVAATDTDKLVDKLTSNVKASSDAELAEGEVWVSKDHNLSDNLQVSLATFGFNPKALENNNNDDNNNNNDDNNNERPE